MQPLAEFLSDQCLSILETRMLYRIVSKSFAQVKVADVSCSSLTHQHYNPVVEGHQIGQAELALSEAMLTLTNYLLIFHVTYCSFYEYLLHDPPMIG